MHTVTVIVSDVSEAGEVNAVLSEAAEDGRLDFAFDVKIEKEDLS